MFGKIFLLLSSLCLCGSGDWVKIPQVPNTPKVTYKVQTIASFSDLPSSSVLAHSDVLSSVFSYNSQKVTSSTTEMPIITKPIEPFEMNKYIQTTVTSKSVDFVPEVSDRIDREELDMHPINLVATRNAKTKVVYMNRTIPIKTLANFVVTEKQISMEHDDPDEDDGVTILDDDENLSSEEFVSEEVYYEYEEEPTTTKAPRKVIPRKTLNKSPQRRVMQAVNKQPLLSSLSFNNFLKFLKSIQNTFTSRTAKNINDKIQMLREFRDNLLMTINQRIKSLWKTQSQAKKKKSRTKRTLGGGWMEEGGALDFPSAESALLSLSFLTFAVFLIKLVLVKPAAIIFQKQI